MAFLDQLPGVLNQLPGPLSQLPGPWNPPAPTGTPTPPPLPRPVVVPPPPQAPSQGGPPQALTPDTRTLPEPWVYTIKGPNFVKDAVTKKDVGTFEVTLSNGDILLFRFDPSAGTPDVKHLQGVPYSTLVTNPPGEEVPALEGEPIRFNATLRNQWQAQQNQIIGQQGNPVLHWITYTDPETGRQSKFAYNEAGQLVAGPIDMGGTRGSIETPSERARALAAAQASIANAQRDVQTGMPRDVAATVKDYVTAQLDAVKANELMITMQELATKGLAGYPQAVKLIDELVTNDLIDPLLAQQWKQNILYNISGQAAQDKQQQSLQS